MHPEIDWITPTSSNICSAELRFSNANFNTLQPPPRNPGGARRANRYKESQWMPCSEALPVAPGSSRFIQTLKHLPIPSQVWPPQRTPSLQWRDVMWRALVGDSIGNCFADQVTGSQQPNTIPQCHMPLVRFLNLDKFGLLSSDLGMSKWITSNISLYSLSSHVGVNWSSDLPVSMILDALWHVNVWASSFASHLAFVNPVVFTSNKNWKDQDGNRNEHDQHRKQRMKNLKQEATK